MTDEEIPQQTSEETEQQMTSEEIIQKMIDKFHRKMAKDEKARAEVEPIEKTMNVDLGEETFRLKVAHAEVVEFEKGMYDQADMYLQTKPEYLLQFIDGSLRPMRAYVTKKVVIKGKIEDILYLKKFF